MALVNDTFLQMVRSETHRGLQGRAAKGFHPGGRCYGYETRPEATPEDAEHPRAEVFINKEEAKVVQRIFTEASQGAGLGTIAGGLNRDGIPAAYDRLGYAKLATGKGWGINQIHYLLRNERYIGKQSWNKRRWFRDPLTKKRRFKLRPEEQWVINDRPDLAIIDAYLWTRVQGRFSKTAGRKRGRPPGSTTVVKYAHLLTGLLRCGVCGGSMTIVGGKQKGTLSYPNFGCSTNHNKGDLACRNRKRVGENLINETVFRAVVEFVSSDEFRTWAADMSRRQQAARRKNQPDEVAALEAAFRSQQATVERVASRYLEADFSDMLKMMLKKEEEKLRGLRGRLALLAQAPKTASTPAVHIDVEQVIETLRDLQQMSKKRPLEARRALHEAIEKVVLVVRKNAAGDDAYEAEVTLRNASATSDGGRVGAKISCGDRI